MREKKQCLTTILVFIYDDFHCYSISIIYCSNNKKKEYCLTKKKEEQIKLIILKREIKDRKQII